MSTQQLRYTFKKIFAILTALLLLFFIMILFFKSNLNSPKATHTVLDVNPSIFTISNKEDLQCKILFSPQNDCLKEIIDSILTSKKEILIQTYCFTSQRIINALIQQSKKNVKIIIIADKMNLKQPFLSKLQNESNIKIYIDQIKRLAHNKIIIIDQNTVLTGSFNLTKTANNNAENLIKFTSKEVLIPYLENFKYRFQKSNLLLPNHPFTTPRIQSENNYKSLHKTPWR